MRLLNSISLFSIPSGSLAQIGKFSASNSLNCTNMCVPWIFNSTAFDLMSNLSSLVKTYYPYSRNKKIKIANGSFSGIAGERSIKLSKHIDLS